MTTASCSAASRAARPVAVLALLAVVAGLSVATVAPQSATRRFLDDDPLTREEDTEDASGTQPWDIVFAYDMMLNLFGHPGDPADGVRAQNVNTIDEVPDSAWFTNRLGSQPMSIDALVRGPDTGTGPAPGRWTVVGPKSSGVTPGFTIVDANDQRWFIEFDPPEAPEAPSGAEVVATKIFWALGYNQAENYLASVRPEQIVIGEGARMRTLAGGRRAMSREDVDAILARAARRPDGSYRVLASKALAGTPLGGFKYFGTRPDDPNDVVPHEHRRELRALKVFGAWTNLVDQKALNTLDMREQDGGRAIVRHYLLDVGSTFGTGALGPHEWDEGWEYVIDLDGTRKRLLTLGFALAPWETVGYREQAAVGRFEAAAFDPHTWRPRVPHAAFLRARADDDFWAARRVAAFSDEMIRTVARVAQYSDPAAAPHLADVLIARRDKIAAAFLTPVNPLVNFAITGSDTLRFENAAVMANAAAAPASYRSRWYRFDNATGQRDLIGEASSPDAPIAAPQGLPQALDSFVCVDVHAEGAPHSSWNAPVEACFQKRPEGWHLIGLSRQVPE